MQVEVHPPFHGPLKVRPSTQVTPFEFIVSLVLAGIGIGLALTAYRLLRDQARLHCAPEMLQGGWTEPVVGVALSYDGDWWADRGERLYWVARRQGATTAQSIGKAIIAADIGGDSSCLTQFPPHIGTLPQNLELWRNLLQLVQLQMDKERGPG